VTAKIQAILPMRSGSRRIRNKNTRFIKGRPLYEYIVNALVGVKLIDRIIINTDIASVLKRYKDKKRFIALKRESHLQGNCNMNLVIEDTLNKVKGEHFLQVHATNPLISVKTINTAIKTYFKHLKKHDSLFSVTKLQKRLWNKDGMALNHNPVASPTTQDLEPYFEENSGLYIFSRSSFMKNKNRIGLKPYLFKTGFIESIDVDTKEELNLVKRLL